MKYLRALFFNMFSQNTWPKMVMDITRYDDITMGFPDEIFRVIRAAVGSTWKMTRSRDHHLQRRWLVCIGKPWIKPPLKWGRKIESYEIFMVKCHMSEIPFMLHYNGLSMSFMLHSWWSILTHATSCCPVACCAAGACWAPVTGSSPTRVMGRLDSRARPLSTMSSAMDLRFLPKKMGGFWSSKPKNGGV